MADINITQLEDLEQHRQGLAVIGLGYVGLPLAVAFGRVFSTIGFDIDQGRWMRLVRVLTERMKHPPEELEAAKFLRCTTDREALKYCSCFVVTVPTPVDSTNRPDFEPLVAASQLLGDIIGAGTVVIFESTVFPGATQEICVPIIEERSGLTFNEGFFVGYSPERINPGDKNRGLQDITKVISASNEQALDFVDQLYQKIITAGTFRAASIQVAEAAKVIENTQRDLNIALINGCLSSSIVWE